MLLFIAICGWCKSAVRTGLSNITVDDNDDYTMTCSIFIIIVFQVWEIVKDEIFQDFLHLEVISLDIRKHKNLDFTLFNTKTTDD